MERLSAGNMKRTWVEDEARDWRALDRVHSDELLREVTQIKNIWIPYGE